MHLNRVPTDDIALIWAVVLPRIQSALSHSVGESSPTDWLRCLLHEQAHLWILHSEKQPLAGLVLTQFLQYKSHKTLHLVLAEADDFSVMSPQWHVLEEFGKENDCIAAESWGRPGWAKMLPKAIHGFEPAYQVMRKEFT